MEANLNDAGSYAASFFWGPGGGVLENAAYIEKLKRKVK